MLIGKSKQCCMLFDSVLYVLDLYYFATLLDYNDRADITQIVSTLMVSFSINRPIINNQYSHVDSCVAHNNAPAHKLEVSGKI